MRGRGCALVLALAASSGAGAAPLSTPSGQAVTLEEILMDENPGALWVRFRFLAPDLSDTGQVDPYRTVDDMQHLCDEIAAPYLEDNDVFPSRIVISMADRIVPFGVSDPSATQVFELFRLQGGVCIWEEF